MKTPATSVHSEAVHNSYNSCRDECSGVVEHLIKYLTVQPILNYFVNQLSLFCLCPDYQQSRVAQKRSHVSNDKDKAGTDIVLQLPSCSPSMSCSLAISVFFLCYNL